jgi:hypothetical protein
MSQDKDPGSDARQQQTPEPSAFERLAKEMVQPAREEPPMTQALREEPGPSTPPPEPSALERFMAAERRETPAAEPDARDAGASTKHDVPALDRPADHATSREGPERVASKQESLAAVATSRPDTVTVREGPGAAFASVANRVTGGAAALTKDALQDFVSRVLYGQTHTPEPDKEHEPDRDKGMER